MATEVHRFSVTTPAGTAKSSPLLTSLAMPPREVERIEVKVPPGPRGELGFALGSSGVTVIPQGPANYIVTDDEEIGWQMSQLWDSGGWQCQSYNTGQFDHTIEVRFLTNPVGTQGGSSAPPPITSGGATGTIDLSGANGAIPPVSILPPLQLPPAPELPPLTLPPLPQLPPLPGLPGLPGGTPAPPPPPKRPGPFDTVEMRILTWMTQQHFLGVDATGQVQHWWNDDSAGVSSTPNNPGITGLAPYAPLAAEVLPTPGVAGASQLHVLTANPQGHLVHAWQDLGSPTWHLETL